MKREINYGQLMHRAMRGLIHDVLAEVAEHGLPGDHHFFITLSTRHPEVAMADWLRERYPEEITIVLQNWYENLVLDDDGFAVTLNFGNRPEPLYIPFDAISTFVDPSVEFGLRFESQGDDENDPMAEAAESDHAEADDETSTEPPKRPADVVSLDQFRK